MYGVRHPGGAAESKHAEKMVARVVMESVGVIKQWLEGDSRERHPPELTPSSGASVGCVRFRGTILT